MLCSLKKKQKKSPRQFTNSVEIDDNTSNLENKFRMNKSQIANDNKLQLRYF